MTNWWYFSYFSQKTGSDISCKLSPLKTVCMKCQNLFSGKKKIRKIFQNLVCWNFAFCLCWGFMAQSTQWGHVELAQFTWPHFYWAGLVLWAVNKYCAHSFTRNWQLPFLNQWKGENDCRKYFMINLHEGKLLTNVLSFNQTANACWSGLSLLTQWCSEDISHVVSHRYTYIRGHVKKDYLVIILG